MGIESTFSKVEEAEKPKTDRMDGNAVGFDKLKSDLHEEFNLDPRESALSDPEEVSRPVEGLDRTRQIIEKLDDGGSIYNSPLATGRRLNHDQGHGVEGMEGTCALVSAENVCRLAGKDITEADVVKVASGRGLCDVGKANSVENGGVWPRDLPKIFDALGVKSSEFSPSCHEDVAEAVESGRGVVAFVNVGRFWDDCPVEGMHAVTLTSVERDPKGKVSAFYVCDSGTGGTDFARRVSADRLADSCEWHSPFIVTDSPIR